MDNTLICTLNERDPNADDVDAADHPLPPSPIHSRSQSEERTERWLPAEKRVRWSEEKRTITAESDRASGQLNCCGAGIQPTGRREDPSNLQGVPLDGVLQRGLESNAIQIKSYS